MASNILSGRRTVVRASLFLIAGILAGSIQAHDLQICKQSDPNNPVTGVFHFIVTGQTGTISVAVGSCVVLTGPGTFTITEQTSSGSVVTNIQVVPVTNQVSTNVASGTATVVVPEGATTTVTFTNSRTVQGRFTGGGSIFTDAGVRVTHGFELHCSTSDLPNTLEVNSAGNQFHLDTLTSVACFLNGDGTVATITGTGTGDYDGVPGATITFTFTDAGEPGANTDFASYVIKDVGGTTVLTASGLLDSGNQQFHPQP